MTPPAPGFVLDDKLLAEPLAEVLGENARHDVGVAASCERHDHRNGPRRPFVLRRCARTKDDERNNKWREKFFHVFPSCFFEPSNALAARLWAPQRPPTTAIVRNHTIRVRNSSFRCSLRVKTDVISRARSTSGLPPRTGVTGHQRSRQLHLQASDKHQVFVGSSVMPGSSLRTAERELLMPQPTPRFFIQ